MSSRALFFGSVDRVASGYRVECLRVGHWDYESLPGGLNVTAELLANLATNFARGVKGPDVPLDGPSRGGEAHSGSDLHDCGWVRRLEVSPDGQSLFAYFDITNPEVADLVNEGSLKYCSSELDLAWYDPESKQTLPVFEGLSLTNRPYIKRMAPIEAVLNLSEAKAAMAGDWEEGKHPRDDDGKFAKKGEGGGNQVSWEAVPGTKEQVLPGIHSASYEDKAAYTKDVADAVLNSGIVEAFGLTLKGVSHVPGYYEGVSNPSVQMRFTSDAPEGAISGLAAAIGKATHQDSVGYHRIQHEPDRSLSNALVIGLTPTPELVSKLGGLLEGLPVFLAAFGDSIRIIKFDEGFDNVEFQEKALEAVDTCGQPRFASAARATSSLVGKQDYESDRHATTSPSGRSDVQGRLGDLVQSVRALRIKYARDKGWGDPDREAELRERKLTPNQNRIEGGLPGDVPGGSPFLLPGASGTPPTQEIHMAEPAVTPKEHAGQAAGADSVKLSELQVQLAATNAQLSAAQAQLAEQGRTIYLDGVKTRLQGLARKGKLTVPIYRKVLNLADVLSADGKTVIQLAAKRKLDDDTESDKLDVVGEVLDMLDNLPGSIADDPEDKDAILADGDPKDDEDDDEKLDKEAKAEMAEADKQGRKISYREALVLAERRVKGGKR